jgi:Tripartite tricarboxylate transporter TctB family
VDEKPSPLADLVTAVGWLLLAVAIVIGAWHMDRLQHLQATIYTMPGLVPGLLGVAIGFMAVILLVRAVRAGALADPRRPKLRLAEHWRLMTALVLCLGYAIGLVGHGLPFWLASTIFVVLFVVAFEYPERRRAGTLARGAFLAFVLAVVSGLVIHYAFQDLFLVRLP